MGAEPDARFVAVGCSDHTTDVWDTAHDQLLARLPSVTPVPGEDFRLFFDADFGSAIGDQLVCQVRVGSDVGEKATQSPARRAPLVDLAAIVLCGSLRSGACHPRSATVLRPGVLGLDALIAHGLYDTCCL